MHDLQHWQGKGLRIPETHTWHCQGDKPCILGAYQLLLCPYGLAFVQLSQAGCELLVLMICVAC